MRRLIRKGQITFEYVIIIGIVALALTMMQVYLRRGIQAGIKMATDEIALQEDYEELEPHKGFLDHSLSVQTTPQDRPAVETTEYQGDGMQTVTFEKRLDSSGDSRYIVK